VVRLVGSFVLLLFAFGARTQVPAQWEWTAEYRNVPLAEVMEELATSHDLQFTYLESAIRDETVDCRFERADWPTVAACLFAANGLAVIDNGDGSLSLRPVPLRPACITVTDADGHPLPFVTLSVTGSGWSGYTDGDGSFRGKLRAGGGDSLKLSFLGYGSQTIPIGPDCRTVVLHQDGVLLADVIVRDFLSRGIRASVDGRSVELRPNELPPLPGFAGTELYRAATLLPGVSLTDEAAANLSIRGGSRDQNLILWDGIPVYGSGHYFGMISPFEPRLVDRMELQRGQARAGYGGRLSGVLELQTDSEVTPDPEIGLDANLLYAGGHAKLPLVAGRTDLQVAARGSVNQIWEGPTYASYRDQVFQRPDGEGRTREFRGLDPPRELSTFGEANFRLLQRVGANGQLRASGFYQRNDYRYREEGRVRRNFLEDQLESTHLGGSLTYRTGGGTTVQLTHSYFDNRGDYRFNERRISAEDRRSNRIGESSLRAERELAIGAGGVRAGLQAQRFTNDYELFRANARAEVEISDAGRTLAYALSPYAEYAGRFGRGGHYRLGLRLPYYDLTDRLYVEPRLSLSYPLADHWLLKGGLAVNNQFISEAVELTAYRVSTRATFWTLADGEEVTPARGREGSLGLTGQYGTWLIDVEGYLKSADGLPGLDNEPEGRRGVSPIDSRGRGVDVLLRRQWSDWLAFATYSLSRLDWVRQRNPGVTFPGNEDRRHQFQLVVNRRMGRFGLGLSWQYRSGSRYTAVPTDVERFRDLNLTAADLNNTRLPAYHRLDASLRYALAETNDASPWHATLELSLLNLYDRRNLLDREYRGRERTVLSGPFNPFFLEEVDRLGLGLTPNVGLRIGFGARAPGS
jgi:outer membrane cobalamin receptor